MCNVRCLFAGVMKLQQAEEQNDRLDAENKRLRERVHIMESENKNLLDQVGTFSFIFSLLRRKLKKGSAIVSVGLVWGLFR